MRTRSMDEQNERWSRRAGRAGKYSPPPLSLSPTTDDHGCKAFDFLLAEMSEGTA